MQYTYHENEVRVMKMRDNAIEVNKKQSNQYKEQLRLKRLGYLFLSFVPISIFFMFFLKMDASNSGFLNAQIYSDYRNSTLGWVHAIAIIWLIYRGLKFLGKANSLEYKASHQIKNELYKTFYEKRAKDDFQIEEIKNRYKNLPDTELEESFRKNIQGGLEGSHVQKLHYLSLHQMFLERYGYSPFYVEKYDTDEKKIELRIGRLPSLA